MKQTGRNDPCPCGSTKKYKHCCLGKNQGQAGTPASVVDTLQTEFQVAVEHHQCGRLPQAEAIYRKILQSAPDHADTLHLLGVISTQQGKAELAIPLIEKAISINPAEPMYHGNLGNALEERGRLDAAAVAYRQALRLNPEFAEARYNLGILLGKQGELDEAIACYRRVLSLNPHFAGAHNNLGNALREQGRLDEAAACYRQALRINPEFANAHNNLGTTLKEQGRRDEAIACYHQALRLNPEQADVHNNLGMALGEQGQLDEAVSCYRRALALNPDLTDALCNLGTALKEQGRLDEAVSCYLKALRLGESAEAKAGFARCVKEIHFASVDNELHRFVVRAISEAWIRPNELSMLAVHLLSLNQPVRECVDRAANAWPERLSRQALFGESGLEAVADDPLLQATLKKMPMTSVAFERFLTLTRHVMLDAALSIESPGGTGAADCDEREGRVLSFYCALARQCFINEYVFAHTDAERANVGMLREKIVSGLAAGASFPALWLVALAAYSSLDSLPSADSLLRPTWPGAVAALLEQQISEPEKERCYRSGIPRLTGFDDGVSRLVQEQYEENPYPRWVSAPIAAKASTLDTFLYRLFPRSSFRPLGKNGKVDILIAGCGTGQQPIETARLFLGGKVLAVDLSLTSLCYASRKTDELGLKNIEYAQADIMKLGTIGRTFDLIESVGVLHHLADPVAGWRVLLGLLRPGGFMRLGFYSELARQAVVAARSDIARRGYAANAVDIRQFRQDLMAQENKGRYEKILSSLDFYGMSDCRDLLFHVQEHRYSLLQLKEIIEMLGLDFIGFTLEASTSRRYLACFPEDQAKTDLLNWHRFETANPDTFAAMYQFWVQKPC